MRGKTWFRTRFRKTPKKYTKTVMEKSWKMIPATMVSVPGFVSPFTSLEADEARPPPMAWITRDKTSQVQKIRRYIFGVSGEEVGPMIWMRRPRIT